MSGGQVPLTTTERRRLPLGNQHTGRRHKPIMCWQAVKGAAIQYGVDDWTAYVDPELTYEENIEIMRNHGVSRERGISATMRELRGREVIRTG